MNKIWLVTQREYRTRIRKKAFLISTVLGPIMMLVMMIVPYWLTSDNDAKQEVWVLDESNDRLAVALQNKLDGYRIVPQVTSDLNQLLSQVEKANAILLVVKKDFKNTAQVSYYSSSSNHSLETVLELAVNEILLENQLSKSGVLISSEFKMIKHPLGVGAEGVKQFLAYGAGVFIYFFIFLYGIQVMKGVIEEKTSRIIEVMLISVKPFQLMVGKILGMTLLGLTQFFIWAGFSSFFYFTIKSKLPIDQLSKVDLASTNLPFEMKMLFHSMFTMDWTFILISFVICFLLGYLLYSSLFAVIGSASDVDTDTQQFLFPLTVPLLLSLMFLPQIIADPNSTLAEVLSFVPFTAPIVLMARVPYANEIDGFAFQYGCALITLILSVVVIMWLASRIYRIGVMIYGQKIGYKHMLRWMLFG